MNTFFNGTRANPKMIITDKQKSYLLAHYSLYTNKQLAEVLGVSESKIFIWLNELGIKKNKGWKPLLTVMPEGEFFKHDRKLATI